MDFATRARTHRVDLRAMTAARALRNACHRGARLWFRGIFYPNTLRCRRPEGLILAPEDIWPGDPGRGRLVLDGRFRFLGRTLKGQDVLSGAARPGAAWMADFHSFVWLRDLRAVGTDSARTRGAALLSAWIERNARWRPVSWRPDVLSNRICNWLTHAEFFEADAETAFLNSLARQVKHLYRVSRFVDQDLDRMVVLKAQIYASLCLPGGGRQLPDLLRRLSQLCDRQLLPDGGHIMRSPAAQLTALRHLADANSVIRAVHGDEPEELRNAIERAAAMVRFFRHGDGGMAVFNGANEGEARTTDAVLSRAGTPGQPVASAPDTGFERIVADRTLLIVDAGRPVRNMPNAHAGTLSFEMSVGKQRIVVNCGAYNGMDDAWRRVQRATAAHSTLTVDDRNLSVLREDGTLGAGPESVLCERLESDDGTLLEMSHDGYARSCGLSHRRRIFVDASGNDIRGEDSLSGTGTRKFAIRFHLHPAVKASLVNSGASVLLRLSDGTGWCLRCKGGTASLQESVYLGKADEIRRSEQIVIAGATQQGDAHVKWAIARLKSV